eukprot:1072257-Pelagomonas_calceolata.AAC.1
MARLVEGMGSIDSPTHMQEDCVESGLGTLKLLAQLSVLLLRGLPIPNHVPYGISFLQIIKPVWVVLGEILLSFTIPNDNKLHMLGLAECKAL